MMVGCTKHQAVEAGELFSDCERLSWFPRLVFNKGKAARLDSHNLCILYRYYIGWMRASADARTIIFNYPWIH